MMHHVMGIVESRTFVSERAELLAIKKDLLKSSVTS